MDLDDASYFALLEKRLGVMRRLAQALEQSQSSIVRMDAAAIEQQAAHQQDLCCAWGALETEVRRAHKTHLFPHKHTNNKPLASSANEAAGLERWALLKQDMAQVEIQIRHLSRVHAALLRRMRRSITVLGNVLATSAGTYLPPCIEPNSAPRLRK